MKNFFAALTVFTAVLVSVHYLLIETVLADQKFFYSVWSIYLFNVVAAVLIYLFLQFVHKSFAEKTGFAFMATSLLKMFAAVIFLIPLIKAKSDTPITDVSAFFIPYFLYLGFETIFAVRLINSTEKP